MDSLFNVFAGSIVLSMQIMSIHMELKSQLKYVKKKGITQLVF
jgi:hypothetical protein